MCPRNFSTAILISGRQSHLLTRTLGQRAKLERRHCEKAGSKPEAIAPEFLAECFHDPSPKIFPVWRRHFDPHRQNGDVPALVRLINAAFIVEQFVFDGDRIDRIETQAFMETGEFWWARIQQAAARRRRGPSGRAAPRACSRSTRDARGKVWGARWLLPQRIIFAQKVVARSICALSARGRHFLPFTAT